MDVDQSVAVVTANIGNFDRPSDIIDPDFYAITDREYPRRYNSMEARLQARIVKTHMWEFVPGYKVYLWVDSSCVLNPGGKEWFIERLGDADIAVFKHPHRNTVQQEADYLEYRLSISCPYITPRYENEDILGQLDHVDANARLFASTAFIMRDSPEVRAAMKNWWYEISRFHSIDQLALPHVIKDLSVNIIRENYLKVPALTYIRNK